MGQQNEDLRFNVTMLVIVSQKAGAVFIDHYDSIYRCTALGGVAEASSMLSQ